MQDKEEFIEISVLDIDGSTSDGFYKIIEREEFLLVFRRYYLHKIW